MGFTLPYVYVLVHFLSFRHLGKINYIRKIRKIRKVRIPEFRGMFLDFMI